MKGPGSTFVWRFPARGHGWYRSKGLRIVISQTFEDGPDQVGVGRRGSKCRIKRLRQTPIYPAKVLTLSHHNAPVIWLGSFLQ